MLDETSIAEAARTYLRESSPVLVLQLDSDLRVVDANPQAQLLLGAGIIGSPLAGRVADIGDAEQLAALIERREGVHIRTLNTTAGMPPTLHFLFFPLASGALALASAGFQEQPSPRGEAAASVHVATWLIQRLVHANKNLRAVHERNNQLAEERKEHNEILRQQSLASLNLLEDAIEARERVVLADAALRASEARAQAIFKGAPDAAYIVYPDGRCVDLNAITLPRYGYSREEFLKMRPSDLVAPELQAEFNWWLERGKQGVVRFESRHRRKNGSEFPVDMSVSPLVLEDLDCLLCTARDATERKAAEEALRRSELRHSRLLEAAPDPILVIGQAGQIVLANTEAERLFGYLRSELLGQSVELIIPLRLREFLAAATTQSHAWTIEGQALRKDGVEIPIELRLSPVRELDDMASQIMLAIRDLSDIRRAEAKFQKLLEAAPDAIVVANGDGEIVLVNSRAEKMFGQGRETLLGNNVDRLFPDRFRVEVAEQRAACLADLQTRSLVAAAEMFGSLQDGREFPIEVSLSPLKTEEGLLVFSAIRDVSERKSTEQRARQLEAVAAEAEAANKAKSMFISTISHEIRTPMNAILGYSQLMLRDSSLADEAKANLKIIIRSGEHLLHMINDILDLAKIEAGRTLLTPRTFELRALLRDLEGMFRLRAAAKGLQLAVPLDDELHYLIADEGKIRQVLINLLANAVNFTEHGGISLHASLVVRPDERVWLCASVEDTGSGMTAEEQSSLFQPFTQGRAGLHTRGLGTGLGLAISQRVAQLMGGQITVKSVLGEGSRFLLEIPVVRAAERDFRRHSGPGARVTGLAAGQGSPRVLIADDRQDNREWLSRLLNKLGFSVRTADDGQAAVQISAEWHPQLILMDMHMPILNGLEAARRIREGPSGRDTIVIAVTADSMNDCRRLVLKYDLNDFITKPCTEDELLEKIRTHLGLVYIYEYEVPGGEAEPVDPEPPLAIDPARLREMPRNLIRRLKDAILSGDKAVLNELILATEVKGDSELTRVLQDLADNYQYDKLLQLLEIASPD